MTVRVNQLWRSLDHEFQVTAAWTQGTERWVQYKNLATGQTHSCLEPAFLVRFTEVTNDDRSRKTHEFRYRNQAV